MGINMKKTGLAILGGVCLFISWLCGMLAILGVVPMDCKSFAVDSSGNLYLGIRNTVYVYRENTLIREMPMLGRSCVFTIQQDDTMLWSTSTNVYLTDLEQNVLQKQEDKGSAVFYRLQGNIGGNTKFVAADGSCYTKQASFGRFRIWKGTELFYVSPSEGQMLLIAIIVSAFGGAGCLLIWSKGRKRNGKTRNFETMGGRK